ncbi:hypothetical protein C8A01DRAFT_32231 [Parachaetomium inaequale]|uniref:Uncharacterized protein n=1 Tax=Parachaetomium inaequale TaxID=2588326 RepID=A0AAN6SV36_9PEZI|nr:hypothetical protein C8A01DRAFT_32231 [Parachaetomium inaequale]
MLFLTILTSIIAILPVCALAAPTDLNGTATIDDAPAPDRTTDEELAFSEALAALRNTVSRASAAHDAGSEEEDPDVLDDLERLLGIIADHVERMREAMQGTNGTNAPPATAASPAEAPAAHHAGTDNRNGDDSNNKAPAPAAGEAAQAPSAAASPAWAWAGPSNTTNDDATEKTPDDPAPVIINQADMFPDADTDADADDTTTQVGGGPQVQYNEPSGAINITCKGISVCNPVTIINEKGGKRIKLEKLDKAAAKGRKKAGKNWKD